jgi:hypothetical protein
MNKFLPALVLTSFLVGSMGCDRGTVGGPNAPTGSDNKAPVVASPKEGTFSIDVPTLAVKLTQGEAKNATISLRRGKNFDQDVKLHFENVPKGITIEPANPTIARSETDAKLNMRAADDAPVGDHTITVSAQPATGAPATNTFTITVHKK